MPTREQIAHDLAIVYMHNRYGAGVEGFFNFTGENGNGSVSTQRLPGPEQVKYRSVPTGERGFMGLQRKQRVEDGRAVDEIFAAMLAEYRQAYRVFLEMQETN